MKRNFFSSIIALAIVLIAGVLAIRNFGEGHSRSKEETELAGLEPVLTSQTTRSKSQSSGAIFRSRQSDENKDFKFFSSEFEKLEIELSGKELDRRKVELLAEASNRLRGKELLALYEYLYRRAQPRYLDWAINNSSVSLIDGNLYDEGLELISRLDNNVLQAKICANIGQMISPSDLPGFIEGLKTNSAKDKVLYAFALQNITHDPVGVIGRIFELATHDLHPAMWNSMASQIRGNPPYENLFELVSRHEDSPHAGPVRKGIFESWVRSDPLAAAQFVSDPQRNKSVESISTVSKAWLAVDPSRAAVWIESLLPGKPKDVGLSVLSSNQLRANPETSLQTANRIIDPKLRRESIATVMDSWLREDPETAKEVYEATIGKPFGPVENESPRRTTFPLPNK